MKNKTASDYSNFITIQDIFHPESRYVPAQAAGTAELVVFDEQPNPATNRWNVVWAEATLMSDDAECVDNAAESSSIPVGLNESDIAVAEQLSPSINPDLVEATKTATKFPSAPYHSGNLLESIIGLSFTIGAVLGTFGYELGASLLYVGVMVMHHSVLFCRRYRCAALYPVTLLLCVVMELVKYILMITDFTLLLASIITSESLALSCGILNSIFSCFSTGLEWHQYIRKLCHLVRWAVRDCHHDWEPPRVFPLFYHPQKFQDVENVDHAVVISSAIKTDQTGPIDMKQESEDHHSNDKRNE
jgi:hypothetical protein